MGKLKEQLAGIAALIAAIVAIGGGFVKYGEITTKLLVAITIWLEWTLSINANIFSLFL